PFPNEPISGDDAVFFHEKSGLLAAVVDGLGHGPEARQASDRAVESLREKRDFPLDEIAAGVDRELAGTRGCVLSIVKYDRSLSVMDSVSLGDVHSHVYHLKEAHFFTATPLIVGAGQFRRQSVRVERKTVEPGSTLVMFTDGLKSRTNLKGQ